MEGNELHAVPNSDVLGNAYGLHAWCPAATDLHAAPNSDGMETVFGLHGASGVAATDLPAATIMDGLGAFPDLHGETNLSGVFRLHDFGGHGGAASVRGDTGSIAFSCGDLLIHDSLADSLHHPIQACAHSCLDGCGEGSGVCDGGIACAPLSSLLCVPGVDDDEEIIRQFMLRVSCNCMCMSGCAAEFTPGSWSPGRNKVFEYGFWGQGLAF